MRLEVAVFGGGCFWCTETVFKMLRGVVSVTPGYAGGITENPTYQILHSDMNEHGEVVRIEFYSSKINFHNLLTVFFGSHDATQVDRQGNDIGREYRSLILYTSEEQKRETEDFIKELNASSNKGKPIATEIAPLTTFYPAEPEHLDFYAKNKNSPYCQVVIAPKLQKVQKEFAELLKNA